MDRTVIEIVATGTARIPEYQTEGSAGADLCAAIDGPFALAPGQRVSVPTGLRVAIPVGYEAQVRPRSGLAARHGLTCLNSPGTIDSDYRGEISVILINLGSDTYTIQPGDRIAQLVVAAVIRPVFRMVETLTQTDRGTGGFGSTGI